MLSETQLDVLKECLNIGIGKAGSVLSEIVGSPVRLKVPVVGICQLPDLCSKLGIESDEDIVSVDQSFSGSLAGDAVLLFPKDSGNLLTQELCGDGEELSDLASECENALLEVGNIVLNAVLGSLSNLFGQSLHFALPSYGEYSPQELVTRLENKSDTGAGAGTVIFARANFDISNLKVTGNVVLIFEIDSFETLMKAIDSHVAESIN